MSMMCVETDWNICLLQCFIIYRHQMGELNTRTDFAQEPSCSPIQNLMFSLRYASRILKHPTEEVGEAS